MRVKQEGSEPPVRKQLVKRATALVKSGENSIPFSERKQRGVEPAAPCAHALTPARVVVVAPLHGE